MKSYIYKNLRTKSYSRMVNGIVVDHHNRLCIVDAVLVVREAGRRRVLAEKRKNVHAFVKGEYEDFTDVPKDAVKITYNPYKWNSFVRCDSWASIKTAKRVWLTEEGMYAEEVA